MTILKRGTCSSEVKISNTVYVCNSCGHTDMDGGKCPKCGNVLTMVSTSTSEKEEENPSDFVQ